MASDPNRTPSKLARFFGTRSTRKTTEPETTTSGPEPFPSFPEPSAAEVAEIEQDHCVFHCQHRVCISPRGFDGAREIFANSKCNCKKEDDVPKPPAFADIHAAAAKANPTLADIDKTKTVTIRSGDIAPFLGYLRQMTKNTAGELEYFANCFVRYSSSAMNTKGTVKPEHQQRTMAVESLLTDLENEALMAFANFLVYFDPSMDPQIHKKLSMLGVVSKMRDAGKYAEIWKTGEGMMAKLVWLFLWRDEQLLEKDKKDVK